MAEKGTDIAVIGGGPAGYSAALRAARLGARVTLIEKGEPGGACLNHACIPTKTLLHALAVQDCIKNTEKFGIETGQASLNVEKLRQHKNAVISLLKSGLTQQLESAGVSFIPGAACLVSHPYDIEICQQDGTTLKLHAEKTIIATGSLPCRLNVPGAAGSGILYPGDILELNHLPRSVIMVGGGVVGVEMASILNGLGCSVTIVELMPRILSCEDAEITRVLEQSLKRNGIKIVCDAQVERIAGSNGKQSICIRCGNTENTLEAEAVCIAVGQRPYFNGLGSEDCNIATDEHGICVDEHMQSSMPGVFAAGDVTGKAMLAYVAMAQGRIAAENAMGKTSIMDYYAIPHCIFTSPELASVGLTEAEAVSRGLHIRCLRSNMAANATAAILGERRGMVKLIADSETGTLLGAHIVASEASSLIPECAIAIKLRATAKDLAQMIHPHPSLSESVWEAALNWQD